MAYDCRQNPLSLQSHCLQYIILNLEQFPNNSLCLLPLSIRKELLWSLTIADVCSLEKTAFTKGIEMEEYWREKPRVHEEDIYGKWPFTTLVPSGEFL